MDITFKDTRKRNEEKAAMRREIIDEIKHVCGDCEKLTEIDKEKYHLPAKKVRGK